MKTVIARVPISFFGGMAALLVLSACAPKYYAPNSQSVPLFSTEGETSVSVSADPGLNRAELRGAMALSTRFAAQGAASLYFPRDTDSGNGGSGGLVELGPGWFGASPSGFRAEAWVLAAYGNVENHFPVSGQNPATAGSLNARLVRVAFQPAVGYTRSWVEAAFSSRLAAVRYFDVRGSLSFDGESQRDYLRDHALQFLVEPAVTLRVGPAPLKLELQLGRSFNLGDGDFPQDDAWIAVGLVHSFRER